MDTVVNIEEFINQQDGMLLEHAKCIEQWEPFAQRFGIVIV